MVVVVRERLHDAGRSVQVQGGPDEDPLHAADAKEGIEELLGGVAVDLRGHARRPQPSVATRVVDVGVEAVLVRYVADAAKPRPEVATVAARQVADEHRRSRAMPARVCGQHRAERPQQPSRAPTAPPAVRASLPDGVPRQIARPARRQLPPPHEAPGPGKPDGV